MPPPCLADGDVFKIQRGESFPNQHRGSELPRKKMTVPSIKSREVSKLRMQSVTKAKRRLSVTQGCFYSAFLVVLGVLSYGNRDSARYFLSKSLDDQIGILRR